MSSVPPARKTHMIEDEFVPPPTDEEIVEAIIAYGFILFGAIGVASTIYYLGRKALNIVR